MTTNHQVETPEEQLLDCEVIEARELTDDLVLLRLRPPSPLAAGAGQFAMLRLAAGASTDPLLGRPMSILGAGVELQFLIRRLGRGTRILTAAKPGDLVTVLGPVGKNWGDPEPDRELIMVAGGVGLAPLLFAAEELAARGGPRPTFLYGARSASELVLLERLEQVSTLKTATDDGSTGHHGLVTELLEGLAAERSELAVWTCGPEPMMEQVARIALRAGLPCRVSVEARMACGRGLCLGCARPDTQGEPRYVCKDGPVFPAADLYGTLAEAEVTHG